MLEQARYRVRYIFFIRPYCSGYDNEVRRLTIVKMKLLLSANYQPGSFSEEFGQVADVML